MSPNFLTTGLASLTLFFAGVNCFAQRSPKQDDDEVKKYTIEQFLETTSYSGASFSPDNSKLLVSSDESGVFNAYEIDIASGEQHALTKSEGDSIFAISYFPSDERVLYTADQGGNELNHVFVRNEDGSATDLTPGENLKAQFLGWAQDEKSFYVGNNQRDQRFFDIYEYQADSLQSELIYQDDQGLFFADISPDGKKIAFAKVATRYDSDIYLYDREEESLELITEHEGDINFQPVEFSPDGKYLYIISDQDSDFLYLTKRDLDTSEIETVFQADWDVSFASFSKNGKYLTIGVNEDARTKLHVFDGQSMEPISLPTIPDASVTSFRISRDEQHAAFYASSAKMPGDLFYLGLDSGEPKKLTNSLNPEIDPDDLVEGQVKKFESFDGLEVPGILYVPKQASEENTVPALVWVHGGPGGQSRIGYRALIQYLVNHGYAIFAINNRGSSGYGKTFESLDNRNHGKNDLMDCVTSKQMLADTGVIDADRIGIIGGSYGGYMTLAALTFQPDAFALGIDIFGISNWYRTVQNIPPWWEAQRKSLENEMGDFTDEEYFKSISPLFHSENIVKPLMVLQGANDPRVLQAESDEIVAAVKANNVPVEYLVFPDEGHGFRKKENQQSAYTAILSFCDKYLRDGIEPNAPKAASAAESIE